MIKRVRLKIAGTLLTIGSVALMVAMVAIAGGCTHNPRTIRIDHVGAEGLDSPQELTDSQKQRIVEIILSTPEAKEQPPTESTYMTRLTWAAIVWDNSHYSYMYSVGLEDVEAGLDYEAVPESAAWYPGATLYYGNPQAPTAEWLIQAYVDLDADKVVYINSLPYSAAPLPPPAPERSSSETNETRTYLTIEELPPAMGEEAPDDIVPTPGGGTYRANVHQQGVENPWPPIESVDVILGSGTDALNISYRDYIETEAGQIRNNIIRIVKEDGLFDSELTLYSTDISAGLELADGGRGVGLPGTLGAILVIEIAPDVSPGEYPLEIGLVINGKDYGTIPCTIEVIEDTQSAAQVPPADEGWFLRPTTKILVHKSVIGNGQSHFEGTTDIYNATLQTQLYQDEKPLDWWPANQDIKANGYVWEISVTFAEDLPIESRYVLKIWDKDNPSLFGIYPFDLQGGPPSEIAVQ